MLGLSFNNTQRYVNVNQLVEAKTKPLFFNALPGLHIFTGSDATAPFFSKANCDLLK